MKMSELLDKHLADPRAGVEFLVRALAKTGPLFYEGQYFAGAITPAGFSLEKGTEGMRGARQATEVEVPEGSYPGVDPEQDAFRGRAIALKASSVRILEAIDQALRTSAGKGGLATIMTALRATQVGAGGEAIDGLSALTSAVSTARQAATEMEAILARQGEG